MDIKGKTAIVTGGASGLGEGAVRRLSSLGAQIAIFDMNQTRGAEIEKELGDKVRYFSVDVTDENSVQTAINATMEAFGAIHILCNFAGIIQPTKTLTKTGPIELEQFVKTVNVNLIGTFNVLRLAAYEMAKHEPVTECGCRGVIINTSSIAAYEGQVGQAAYSASKGGILGMTLPIARDLERNGIRVNALVPGIIHTPMFDSLGEDVYDSLSKTVLFPKRLGRPDEVAHLVQFLIENDYINGEAVRLDGGIRMQPR